jgi:gamma-glutamyltranspeptidase / glutathione hydrolase
VGEDVLRTGGNAVDAIVAAAFVEGVENPLFCGIGGNMSLYYHRAGRGVDTFLNAEHLLGSAKPPAYWSDSYIGETPGHRVALKDHSNALGYKAIAVPGFVKGCWLAYREFGSGRFSWVELLQPAIELAQSGIEVSPAAMLGWRFVWAQDAARGGPEKLRTTGTAERLFHRPDGSRMILGHRLVQEELAGTLETLARNGGDDFYTGDIGGAIAADLGANGALVTEGDVRTYHAEHDAPLAGSYRGLEVKAQPFSNGCHLIEMLQILEHFDLASVGPNDGFYLDVLGKVMRAGWSDYRRTQYVPRGEAKSLEEELVGPDRARAWAELIKSGDPIYLDERVSAVGMPRSGTTHIHCADAEGNVASINHSVGIGGSGVVTPGLGFLYNNEVQFYTPLPGYPHSIAPGKRFFGGGSPLALFRGGEPYVLAGAPGGTRISTAILQAVVNVVDFGFDPQTAVTMPRIHSEHAHTVLIEPTFSETVEQDLSSAGNEVVRNRYQARPQLLVWAKDGIEAGTDPRSAGGVGRWPGHDWATDLAPRIVRSSGRTR